MPTRSQLSPLILPIVASLAATLACGASAAPRPRQADAPRGASLPPATADELLVRGSVETDADVARVIRESYTKYEYRVPMRDGAKLFTVAYVPKDPAHSYPMLLTRTPYSVGWYGADVYPNDKNARSLRRFAPSTQIIKEGYIIVHQDVRGRMMSEGTFVDIRPHAPSKGDIDESTDAYDTIDWLVKNVPNNTGKVGVWGISYPGFYAAQSAVDAHPALKAVSPQAPVTEWFLGDDFHHNGVLFLGEAFDFYSSFGKPRPEPTKKSDSASLHEGQDAYDFFLSMGPLANANATFLKDKIPFWNDLMAHPTRDDFWKARDPRPFYRDSKPAIMTVGGWLDKEDLFGALETYRSFEKQGPKNENVLVMGPWRHGGWARNDGERHGDIAFGQKTSAFYREHIELPFFQRHLKDKKAPAAPEAWIFESGTNEWRTFPVWPPPAAKPTQLFFQANGKLAATAPVEGGEDAYVSDPMKPVPYRAKPGDGIDAEYMSDDQRFAARRPDVVVYSTGDLDGDVTLAGPIEASLWVATTGTDADFVVKLIDVWPADAPEPEPNPTSIQMGGYQQLIRAEIMRAKFRTSFERPEPLKPNEPTHVGFKLPDVSHTFRPGHRIMVQVQSSWFPLAERNPQSFVDTAKATEADFKTATHRIFRSNDKPSSIKVPLLRGSLR
jgi:uncharacterized protein